MASILAGKLRVHTFEPYKLPRLYTLCEVTLTGKKLKTFEFKTCLSQTDAFCAHSVAETTQMNFS